MRRSHDQDLKELNSFFFYIFFVAGACERVNYELGEPLTELRGASTPKESYLKQTKKCLRVYCVGIRCFVAKGQLDQLSKT